MKKIKWVEPKVTNLAVKKTEFGTDITNHVDDTTYVGKDTYYSFS